MLCRLPRRSSDHCVLQFREDGINEAIENLLCARDAFLRLSKANTAAAYCKEGYAEVRVPFSDYIEITCV